MNSPSSRCTLWAEKHDKHLFALLWVIWGEREFYLVKSSVCLETSPLCFESLIPCGFLSSCTSYFHPDSFHLSFISILLAQRTVISLLVNKYRCSEMIESIGTGVTESLIACTWSNRCQWNTEKPSTLWWLDSFFPIVSCNWTEQQGICSL